MAISILLNIAVLNANGVLNTCYLWGWGGKREPSESINLLFTSLYNEGNVTLLNEKSLAFSEKALLIKEQFLEVIRASYNAER